ncbi:Astra associated protein 1 Asa1 [Neophaeococcomyces mojaviensis]|uniref:Astra associated protein 1 Asa1 n=1 Tax=Neophaeococcomyces mojaviensis TaxID=3383035 RepID=A0ACC3A2J2_9EURO|nr:Astra associated protein 1 Asa1 [Knufia sp. JES_112]
MLPSNSPAPPIPAYIFRGHHVAIHALHFFQNNRFFASGDSDGWIVVWRLTTRRPAAAWKAHEGGIMGIKDWDGTRLLSHGRDHKLRVWQLRPSDFEGLSVKLPLDGTTAEDVKQPWLLYTMPINALNFCAFATCTDPDASVSKESELASLLIAAPNGLDSGGVDVFRLPSENRVSKVQSDKNVNTGMVMSLRIFNAQSTGRLTLVIGYEGGQVMVFERRKQDSTLVWGWDQVLVGQPHKQPVLSLDVTPDHTAFITSSADATVTKYALSKAEAKQAEPEKTFNTKHAGQQDLKIRLDGQLFVTAGWDKNIRVWLCSHGIKKVVTPSPSQKFYLQPHVNAPKQVK